MRKPWKRRAKRFDAPSKVASATCKQLLSDVWSLDWEDVHGAGPPSKRLTPPSPYIDYWLNLIQTFDHPKLRLNDSEVAAGLIKVLQGGLAKQLPDLKDLIQQQYPNKIATSPITPDQGFNAFEFAVRLWLHIAPNLHQTKVLPQINLRQLIEENIPEKAANTLDIPQILSHDFCVRHLRRKGDIGVLWTDDINKHLTLEADDHYINVFRHSNMLRVLAQDSNNDPFPPGFTRETLDTLDLLFRPMDVRKAHENIKRMNKHPKDTDLELAMLKETGFKIKWHLNHYRYWHSRLAAIQKVYNSKKPSTLQSWWFDRRDRVQWATFWVAFVVFVLTVVFGVIQSITGILSAWAAFHPISSS